MGNGNHSSNVENSDGSLVHCTRKMMKSHKKEIEHKKNNYLSESGPGPG